MYERFTDRSRRCLLHAIQEAQRLHHEYVDTGHLLLGVMQEKAGVAGTVLRLLGTDAAAIRAELARVMQPGQPGGPTLGKLPQTPRAKKALEFAAEEAAALGHTYVGTEHLLLGLLREDQGVAAQVLANLGLKPDDVRREVLAMLGPGGRPEVAEAVRPMSCHAFAKVWRCDCEWEPDGEHCVHLWEPLDVDAPESARPHCYGVAEIDFYDRTGNQVLHRYVRHHDLMAAGNSVVLLNNGRFYEVASGRCVWRKGRWFMRWWCGDNTRLARMLNAGFEEYQK